MNRREVNRMVNLIKAERGCAVCGYNKCLKALDFHHAEGEEKMFGIGHAINKCLDPLLVLKEIDKCVVLCKNCHTEWHEALR